MEYSIWISIASICIIGAMSPGPSLAVVVRNTISGGRIQGILTGIGHCLGIGLYASLAVFGIAFLIEQFPNIVHTIQLLGGLYLLWMGFQSWKHAGKGTIQKAKEKQYQGFYDGLAISALNPKTAVFFLALFGPLIPLDASNIERLGVALLALFIDGIWYSFVAIMMVQLRLVDWLMHQGERVDRILGGLLIGLGVWLLRT